MYQSHATRMHGVISRTGVVPKFPYPAAGEHHASEHFDRTTLTREREALSYRHWCHPSPSHVKSVIPSPSSEPLRQRGRVGETVQASDGDAAPLFQLPCPRSCSLVRGVHHSVSVMLVDPTPLLPKQNRNKVLFTVGRQLTTR